MGDRERQPNTDESERYDKKTLNRTRMFEYRDHHAEVDLRAKVNTGSLPISDDDSGCAVLDEYAWVPPGLTPKQVQAYFNRMPERYVPYIDSDGEKWRNQQLIDQLPPQDNEARYCSGLSPEEENEPQLFATQRKQNAFGRGSVRPYLPTSFTPTRCSMNCGQTIKYNDMMVTAQRAGHLAAWHPECFRCTKCDELLVDLQYYWAEGALYCGRHHAELMKPRCDHCDEIIFADECTEAEGNHWHMRHFKCTGCSCILGGQRYIMREKKPFCTTCFESRFAECCHACHQPIGLDEGQMQYHGYHWHATDRCFGCNTCNKSLIGLPFMPKNGAIFCSKDCADALNVTSSSQQQFQAAQQPLSQYVRHSVNFDQFEENSLSKE